MMEIPTFTRIAEVVTTVAPVNFQPRVNTPTATKLIEQLRKHGHPSVQAAIAKADIARMRAIEPSPEERELWDRLGKAMRGDPNENEAVLRQWIEDEEQMAYLRARKEKNDDGCLLALLPLLWPLLLVGAALVQSLA